MGKCQDSIKLDFAFQEKVVKACSKKEKVVKLVKFTFTKKPPANIKVMTVTEAKVVALFKSISVAPIASPSPYSQK